MDLERLVREERDAILEVARRHGVTSVRVFGSVARRESRPGSDLDLLVELAPRRSLLDLVGFELELGERLGVKVDAHTEPSLHPIFRDRVLAQAVPV